MYNKEYYNGKTFNQRSGFAKTVTEASVSLAESSTRKPVKKLADTSSLSDVVTGLRGFVRAVSESALSLADSITRRTGKVLADAPGVADVVGSINSFFRTITESSLGVTESIGQAVSKFFASSLNAVDSVLRGVVKSFADSSVLADVIATVTGMGILIEDTLSLADEIITSIFHRFSVLVEETVDLAESFVTTTYHAFILLVADTVSIVESIPKHWSGFISGIPKIVSSVFAKANMGSAIRQKPRNNDTIKLANHIGSAISKRPKY